MSVETIQAAYAAFAKNDPSVLLGAMAPDIQWHQAQGNPLADRNPYVGDKRLAKAYSAGCSPPSTASARRPIGSSTAATTSSCSAATAAR